MAHVGERLPFVLQAMTDLPVQILLHPFLILAKVLEFSVNVALRKPVPLTPLYDKHLAPLWRRNSSPILSSQRGVVLWLVLTTCDALSDIGFALNIVLSDSHKVSLGNKTFLAFFSLLSAFLGIGYLIYALRTYLQIRARLELQGLNSFMYAKAIADDLPHVGLAVVALATGAGVYQSVNFVKLAIASFVAGFILCFCRYKYLTDPSGIDPSVRLTEDALSEQLLPDLPHNQGPLSRGGTIVERSPRWSAADPDPIPEATVDAVFEGGYMDVHTAKARHAESTYLQLGNDAGDSPYVEFQEASDPYIQVDTPEARAAEHSYLEIADKPSQPRPRKGRFWEMSPAYQLLPPSRRQPLDQAMGYFLVRKCQLCGSLTVRPVF